MNLSHKLLATLVSVVTSCSAFAGSSLTFQDVIFSAEALDTDTLRFTMTGANTASGDWSGVQYIKAFSFKDIGSIASFNVVSGPSFATIAESSRELSARGCTGGSSGGACFTFAQPTALTSTMSWTIDFVAAAGNQLDFSAPHLKVDFFTTLTDTKKTGSLLSQSMVPTVTAVPEPESYVLFLAGLAGVAAMARRRQNRTR